MSRGVDHRKTSLLASTITSAQRACRVPRRFLPSPVGSSCACLLSLTAMKARSRARREGRARQEAGRLVVVDAAGGGGSRYGEPGPTRDSAPHGEDASKPPHRGQRSIRGDDHATAHRDGQDRQVCVRPGPIRLDHLDRAVHELDRPGHHWIGDVEEQVGQQEQGHDTRDSHRAGMLHDPAATGPARSGRRRRFRRAQPPASVRARACPNARTRL